MKNFSARSSSQAQRLSALCSAFAGTTIVLVPIVSKRALSFNNVIVQHFDFSWLFKLLKGLQFELTRPAIIELLLIVSAFIIVNFKMFAPVRGLEPRGAPERATGI